MHVLVAIFGILAAAAFWWYRAKYISDAASEVADAVGKARGAYRRNAMRKKAAVAPVTAIDDPVVAAATVIMAIAAEDAAVTPEIEARVRDTVSKIADSKKLDEAVIYAKWASDQIADVNTVIDKAADFLSGRLNETEKEELIAMTEAAMPRAERHMMFAKRIERLRKKLGLVVN
jgi:hypothetical protein